MSFLTPLFSCFCCIFDQSEEKWHPEQQSILSHSWNALQELWNWNGKWVVKNGNALTFSCFFPLFQRSWKEPFFVISINVAFVFALLSSWGTIFLRWCSVLIRLRWAGLGAAVEGFTALRMAQPCLEFEKLSQSVTASRCACISYLMKLKRTPVSGRLVKKKQLTHNWYNDL